MANSVNYKEIALTIGDMVAVDYRIKESENKERIQQFSGIIIKMKGNSDTTRMITVRKISKSGIGVERIFPLASPFIADITIEKQSEFRKARAYFVRDLSNKNLRRKLYKTKLSAEELKKKNAKAKKAKTAPKVEVKEEVKKETAADTKKVEEAAKE